MRAGPPAGLPSFSRARVDRATLFASRRGNGGRSVAGRPRTDLAARWREPNVPRRCPAGAWRSATIGAMTTHDDQQPTMTARRKEVARLRREASDARTGWMTDGGVANGESPWRTKMHDLYAEANRIDAEVKAQAAERAAARKATASRPGRCSRGNPSPARGRPASLSPARSAGCSRARSASAGGAPVRIGAG